MSKVTIEQATAQLELTASEEQQDSHRACERCLKALLDFAPQANAISLLQSGLVHSNPSTRISSVEKLSSSSYFFNEDVLISFCLRIRDVDTRVSTVVAQALKSLLLGPQRVVVISTLVQILDRQAAPLDKSLDCDWETHALRVWEFAAAANLGSLLESLFVNLETPNPDVLFVLNALEIAARVPRQFLSRSSQHSTLIQTLLGYVKQDSLAASDALRVLTSLFALQEKDSPQLKEYLTILQQRVESRDLLSLELVGTYLGWNISSLRRITFIQEWLTLCCKLCYEGNDLPRNVAFDALARGCRGGSRLSRPLDDPVDVSIRRDGNQAKEFSTELFVHLRPFVDSIYRSLTLAIKSLHPHVQLSAYKLARVLVSQDAPWGIQTLFTCMPRQVWFDDKMPSPNANTQCWENRQAVLQVACVQFLDEDKDSELIAMIAKRSGAVVRGRQAPDFQLEENI